MGQNSTEVAYGFGQLGSVFTNLAQSVYPPKDHVIVAINFKVQDKWTDLLQLVLITVIGAYFGGRSLEKVKK